MKCSKFRTENSDFKCSHFPSKDILVIFQSNFSADHPGDVSIAEFYFGSWYHFRLKVNSGFVIDLILVFEVKQQITKRISFKVG